MNERNSILVSFRLDAQSDDFTFTFPLKHSLFVLTLSLEMDLYSHSAGEFYY